MPTDAADSFPVLLIGASTRAAATSALRAGWSPWCADLFADADLQRIAAVQKIPANDYPHGLFTALASAPRAPVIYTGALENRPDLITGIRQPLWGNTAPVLRAIRTPELWTQCLREGGLSCPAIRTEPSTAGRWLLKQRKSGGGFGIQAYAGQPFSPRTHFLQEWIEGIPCSAVFVGAESGATLLGVTQQIIGATWLHATGFHYAGSLGPLPLDNSTRTSWQELGTTLTKIFNLRGLFGIDAILRDGISWPIEINPRYTASVEILERAFRVPLLPLHRAVIGRAIVPRVRFASSCFHAKAILFATEIFTFPHEGPWRAALQDGVDLDRTEFADIPHPGDLILKGQPILTLFTTAPSLSECWTKLQESALALDRCWQG